MPFQAKLQHLFAALCIFVVHATYVAHAQCTNVHVVFARGSGELPGLGICGTPLVSGIKSNLQGKSVSSYAVSYLADLAQTSAGPGATDMTKHIVTYAAQCPNAVFVIGGYSQGGSVTDIAIGIKTILGVGQTIPTSLAPRVKAVVVFGNPLKLFGKTIKSASPLYGSKALEFCNFGDPVCAAGVNGLAHLTYATDGSVRKAAQQAAALVTANDVPLLTQASSSGNDSSVSSASILASDDPSALSKLSSIITNLPSASPAAGQSGATSSSFNFGSLGRFSGSN